MSSKLFKKPEFFCSPVRQLKQTAKDIAFNKVHILIRIVSFAVPCPRQAGPLGNGHFIPNLKNKKGIRNHFSYAFSF
jgi:hypothetical protein